MNQKEKLIEIINNVIRCDKCGIVPEWIAEDLIFYGVTVQEWISVNDKLPNDREWVLVWHTGYATPKKAKYKDDFAPFLPVFLIDGDNGNKGEVTHWIPLPKPPKGE